MPTPESRLRPAPSARLGEPERHIDLQAMAERLRHETTPSRSGHRQETLQHRGSARLILFVFDAGGHMARHSAPGQVTIQVLRGLVRVTTPSLTYDLEAQHLLTLDPGVVHDVIALAESEMLLGIALETGH